MTVLVPPLSKSDAQRALVLADVLGVPFEQLLPEGEELPRDVVVLRDGLIALRGGRVAEHAVAASPHAGVVHAVDARSRGGLNAGEAHGRPRDELSAGEAHARPRDELSVGEAHARRRDELPAGEGHARRHDELPAGEGHARPRDELPAGEARAPLRIDCRDGGAPFRFLVTQAAVQPGRHVEFVGTARLGERPHAPLLAALRAGVPGLRLTEGTPWPVTVASPASLPGPFHFRVSGVESSQFASSLLLGAARLVRSGAEVRVTVEGALTSEGYLALTRSWLERVGFGFDGERLIAGAPTGFPPVPGDWSSLGYLLAFSWASGLAVARVQLGTGHPDEHLATLLREVGLSLGDGRVTGTPTRGFEVSGERCPDAIPTLAAWATKLPVPSVFTHLDILRHKESDRLEGIVALLGAAGLEFELRASTLTVWPGAMTRELRFDAHDDHRLAMSAAVLARLHDQPLVLRGAESVSKSFPGFWREAAKAGVRWRALE